MMTFAPARTSCSDAKYPRPALDPVTRYTRPVRSGRLRGSHVTASTLRPRRTLNTPCDGIAWTHAHAVRHRMLAHRHGRCARPREHAGSRGVTAAGAVARTGCAVPRADQHL